MEKFNHTLVFYVVFATSLVIARVPYIGKVFRIINTLIHESGHALMAVLSSAKIHKIELFSDTSGTAITQSDNRFSKILISLAGYPTSALISVLFFYFISIEKYIFIFFILGFFSIVNLVFFVRNLYGVVWLIFFIALIGAILYFENPTVNYIAALFFSGIILNDSLISSMILIPMSIKTPKKTGDASNLRDAALLPAFFWSLLFVAVNLFALALIVFRVFPIIKDYQIL